MSDKKDLDDLAKSFKAATDAAGKLTIAEQRLAGASDEAAAAIGKIAAQVAKCLGPVTSLEAQVAAVAKVASPLASALSSVNDEMAELAALSKDSGKATDIHVKGLKETEKLAAEVAKRIEALSGAHKKSGEVAKLSGENVKKLGGSLKATFDSLASGADPFKVFLEQGPGIAEVFANAAKGGVGLRGVLLGIAETVAPLALPFAAVAAGAAAIAAPFAIGAAAINQSNKDITAGLGLTADQLKNVKDKSVTMGDVATATFQVLGDKLQSAFGPTIKEAGENFQKFLAGFAKPTAEAIATVIGAFAGGFAAIKATWSMLPAAIGDLVISAVNILIDGVEKMVNGAITLVNGMIISVNGIAKKLGLSINLPELGDVHIARLNNKYAGAAKAVADVAGKAYEAAFKKAHDGTIATFSEISDKSVKVAQERIKKSVPKSEAHGGVAGKAGEAAQARDFSDVTFKEPVSVVQEAVVEGIRPSVVNVEGLAAFVDPISKSFDELIEKLTAINALAPELGKQFEAAFGKTGKALGGVLTSFSAYSLEVAKINREAAGRDLTPEEREKRTQVQIKGYAAMAGAAKGFFKEGTDGYKAMQVAEIAFHTIETLNTIKSMALKGAADASAITGEVGKQAAFSATAYAKTLSSLPFPLNLMAGAAVLAALVQVGAAIKGKPSGGSVPGASDMENQQKAQGSGSVLGDSKAKSDSLEKALTQAQAYENKDLEYGNAMVRSLKSIDDQIGAVASALAKSFGAGGMLSTEGLNLGKTGTSASLSNFGFSKSTTRTLQDQGIQFSAASLGDIANGLLGGSTYQQVLETTTKKAFFLKSSSKSKVITETGSLDADFLGQVTELIKSMGKGVSDAAKALGETGVEAALASFTVDLGKLSFKDMTGTQIEEALTAIFGKLGDDMAKSALPAIAQFQKVGEGAFETLVRVARQYEVIDTTLKSVGMKFVEVGAASLEARERLVDLVGGLDNLTDQTAFFAEHFLSEAERLKPVQDHVNERLTELKLPGDLSRDDFKTLVLGQNVATKEGAELYAALMDLAPAFDKVATAAESAKTAAGDKRTSIQDQIDELTMSSAQKLAKAHDSERKAAVALDDALGPLLDTLWGLQHAAEVEEKRKSIQDQIDDLTLSSAQLLAKSRAAEMEAVKALDDTLVPLVENLWKLQDAAAAAKLETDRSNMLASLMEAQGRTEEAKRLRRNLALTQIEDPVQKLYQQQIWAAEDAAAKVSAARDVLTQAYQREQDAIQATKDKFKELSTSLRAFSVSLTGAIAGTDPATRYRRSRETFLSTAALARLGDADAMGRLQTEGEAFTTASRDYVSTSLDYLRDVGLVRAAVDEAADTADRQVSIAQRQLDALDASVQGLIEIKASVVSVEQAILSLQGALGEARAAGVVSVGGSSLGLVDTAPASAGSGVSSSLTRAEKALNSARFDWILANSLAGKANAGSTDPVVKAVNDNAARYNPGFMDIVNTQGSEAAHALVAAGKLSYTQDGSLRFATGGSFEVGGSGPPDSKLFSLALSPGEAVNVRRRDAPAEQPLIDELRNLRAELADLRASNARIATSNDKMERTLTNVTEGGRAMQTQAAA